LREYLQEIHDLLSSTPQITAFSVSFDERSAKAAFLHGNIALVDGSSLYFKEFLVADPEIRKVKYGYQWVSKDGTLSFRYDNAADPAARLLRTYPHHKHTASGIVEAEEATLATVLREIVGLMPRM
jgi:hypothetical protein